MGNNPFRLDPAVFNIVAGGEMNPRWAEKVAKGEEYIKELEKEQEELKAKLETLQERKTRDGSVYSFFYRAAHWSVNKFDQFTSSCKRTKS